MERNHSHTIATPAALNFYIYKQTNRNSMTAGWLLGLDVKVIFFMEKI